MVQHFTRLSPKGLVVKALVISSCHPRDGPSWSWRKTSTIKGL